MEDGAVIALMRAFVGEDGGGGNPALVIRECAGDGWNDEDRMRVAVENGVPATVFIADGGDRVAPRIRIFGSYGLPIEFGGHPTLATVEALHRWGVDVTSLRPNAGEVRTRRDSGTGMVHVTAPASWSKPWRHLQLAAPETIDGLTELPAGEDFTQVWAWIDEPAGVIRARLWAPRINKGEDEACGSASMILADRLGRALTVIHGQGRSVIRVTPHGEGVVELGGRCVEEPVPAAIEALVRDVREGLDRVR